MLASTIVENEFVKEEVAKAWRDFTETFMEFSRFKTRGLKLIGQIKSWAVNFQNIKIIHCMDDYISDALIVVFPAAEKSTIVCVPQGNNETDPYVFFVPTKNLEALRSQ